METTIKELSDRLASQAEAVARMLLPGGKQDHGQWICGDLTGKPGESLKVCTHGSYVGKWQDWATDEKGDLIDLWRLTKDLTPSEAIKQVKAYLGVVDPVRSYEAKSYGKPPSIKSDQLNEKGSAMAYLTQKRKLHVSTVRSFKIEGSTEKRAIIFPCYSPGGVLVNRSYRTLTEPKKVWQDKDCAPCMFGWQALPESAYRDRIVLLSEGQIDAATWHQWGVPALSIPNGSGTSWVEYEWDNLSAFDLFYLAFDQDSAGSKTAERVLTRLGKHRCLLVSMPEKDANACLQEGYTSKDAAEWLKKAKAPKIKSLVLASEMEDRFINEIQYKAEPFTLEFFRGYWPHSGFYYRPGEVTIWGGGTGVGKSTMLTFLTLALLCCGIRVFEASLELKVETTLRRLATMYLGRCPDEAEAREFLRLVGQYLVFADVVGSIKQNELMEMLWFAFRRYGVRHFIIDSLMRIEGLEEEYDLQGQFLNDLQNFAKETGSHVHLVAHLAKPSGNSALPSMYNVKGSSLIINNADNVLLVARNPEKEKRRKAGKLTHEDELMMHDTEVIVEKQRETGWLHTFKLKFDTKRLIYRILPGTEVRKEPERSPQEED